MAGIIDNTGGKKNERILKDKKLRDIERDVKGNDLLKKFGKFTFPPFSEADKRRMEKLDRLGNPRTLRVNTILYNSLFNYIQEENKVEDVYVKMYIKDNILFMEDKIDNFTHKIVPTDDI